MTDPAPDDVRFEQRIRDVFADLAPATAPASLRAAVAAVPGRRAGQAPGKARLLVAAMGLAAAVVIAIAGIGLLGGRLPVGPAVAPPTGGVPSAAPSPSPAAVTLTFDVMTPDGSMATKAQTDAVGSVMQERLRDYGIGTFATSYSDDRITFDVALPSDAIRRRSPPCATCSAPPARSRSVLAGRELRSSRATPSTGAPLFTGDAVTDARVAASGQRRARRSTWRSTPRPRRPWPTPPGRTSANTSSSRSTGWRSRRR